MHLWPLDSPLWFPWTNWKIMIIVGFIIKNSNFMSHHTLFNSYGPSSDARPIKTYGLMTCGFYEILFSIRSWCCMLLVVVTLGIFKCCLINNKNHMFFWSKKNICYSDRASYLATCDLCI